MIKIILIAIGLFLLLFLYCACVISSKCSREEEKDEQFRKIQNVIKWGMSRKMCKLFEIS